MKKILLIIFLSSISIYASELKITEFNKLSNDYYAITNPVFDFDKQYCTALKVEFYNCQLLTLNQKVFKKKSLVKTNAIFLSRIKKRNYI